MSLILHIETSTEICSAALSKNGKVLSGRDNSEGKTHAEKLTVYIQEMLSEQGLTANALQAVAVSKGPGSYTGLRIGISAAKGICYAAGIPLIGISTLQLMAFTATLDQALKKLKINDLEKAWFCPMIDARRMEVYTAFFDIRNTRQTELSADIITGESYSEILHERPVIFFGNGSDKCREALKHKNAFFLTDIVPLAVNMIPLALLSFKEKQFENTAYFEPYYLKDFIPTIPKNKLQT